VHPAEAADVKAARVWASPDYTRVVFDLSGPADYKLSQGDTPGSIVLDLDKSSVVGGFASPAAQGLFKGLRTDQQGKGARLIATADPTAKPKSFLLKPTGEYGYRLVLDLYPGNADKPRATVSVRSSSPSSPSSSTSSLPSTERKVIVAIDAGHGGEDPGARGAVMREKDVTLMVARELANQINQQPGMQAVLTRDGDYFIPLKRRYEIAREHNADLFVSIHADAFKNSDAKGSSVWVLSPRGKTSEASRWLADRENRADLVGGVSLDDKDDTLAAVLLDLQQGYAMQASESIAGNVLTALGQLGPTHRGFIERANFVVLRSPDVPSILVETAFITNPDEERRLQSDSHRRQLATAVLGGVKSYFESTPPPGTWFAAQSARRNGTMVAQVATSAAKAITSPVSSTIASVVANDAVKSAPRMNSSRADRKASDSVAVQDKAADNATDNQRDGADDDVAAADTVKNVSKDASSRSAKSDQGASVAQPVAQPKTADNSVAAASASSPTKSSPSKNSPKSPVVALEPGARRPASDAIVVVKSTTPPPLRLASAKPAGRADDNVRDVHRVNRGETLTGIAQQYGVSVDALKSANRISDDNVRIGAVLAIPST
jgi:N-acetylmuramoyl-L-alanine amidase